MGSINKYAKKRLEALEVEEGGDPKQRERLRAMQDAEDNLVKKTKAPLAPASPPQTPGEETPEMKRKREINERLKRRQKTLDSIK